MYEQRSILEEMPDPKKIIPEEMPNQKDLELGEVSIIPAPLINPKEEEEGDKNKHYRVEKRLEKVPPLPIVILPWKKSKKTLNNWVKKNMWSYPTTWNWFFAYFDAEPVHGKKVSGYSVELCSEREKYDFDFRNRFYEVGKYEFDEIEWARSTFYNVLDNIDAYQKNTRETNEKLRDLFKWKNNKKR